MSPRGQAGIRFSDRVVADLACPEGRKDTLFFDGDLPGFGLRVTSQGARTFLFQYRAGSKVRRHRIGQWGRDGEGLSTAQARKLASVQYGLVAGGADPVAAGRAQREAAAAAEAADRDRRKARAYTVGSLIDDWGEKHLASRRFSYRRDALGRLRLHLKAMLGAPASSVTRADAVRLVDHIAAGAGETTARRTIGYARAAYGWAMKRGTVQANPFLDVPMPGRDVRRDRVLTPGEVAEVWAATYKLLAPYGAFTRFLLLTLQRREEVAGMTWSEVAADLATWELPAARAKNGKAHTIHLSAPGAGRARGDRTWGAW